VKDLRREATALKEVVADLTLENRLLKKTYGPPVCKRILRRSEQSASTYYGLMSKPMAKMDIRTFRAP